MEKKSWRIVIELLVVAFVAVVFYKTGRGDSWEIEHAAVTWSQRAQAAAEALDAANAELTECLLEQGGRIVFPRDTAIAQTTTREVLP